MRKGIRSAFSVRLIIYAVVALMYGYQLVNEASKQTDEGLSSAVKANY